MYLCIYILVYIYKRKNILNTNYTKLKYFLTFLLTFCIYLKTHIY